MITVATNIVSTGFQQFSQSDGQIVRTGINVNGTPTKTVTEPSGQKPENYGACNN